MILRKIRAFRRGTARYRVSGIEGLSDDDRAIVSVWPAEGGVTIYVAIGGDRLTARIDVATALPADRVSLDLVREHATALLITLTNQGSARRRIVEHFGAEGVGK